MAYSVEKTLPVAWLYEQLLPLPGFEPLNSMTVTMGK